MFLTYLRLILIWLGNAMCCPYLECVLEVTIIYTAVHPEASVRCLFGMCKYVFTFYPVSQFAVVQFCHNSCLPGGSREQDTAAGEDYRIHGHQQNNGEGEASEQRNRLLPDSSWQREGRKLTSHQWSVDSILAGESILNNSYRMEFFFWIMEKPW